MGGPQASNKNLFIYLFVYLFIILSAWRVGNI